MQVLGVMILDISPNKRMPYSCIELYNMVAMELRHPFDAIIKSLYEGRMQDIEWMVTSPLSRNPFGSYLFHYIVTFELIQRLIERGESIDEIVTDSVAQKKIIRTWLKSQGLTIRVSLKSTFASVFKKRFLPLSRLIYCIAKNLWTFYQVRKTQSKKNVLPLEKLTLIDTYITDSFTDKEQYYPGLCERLSTKEQRSVFFVPTFHIYGLKSISSYIRRAHNAKGQFIFKEDYLRLSDYLYAWGNALRPCRMNVAPTLFESIDIAPLVREEIQNLQGYYSAVGALLNLRFAKRLKNAGIQLRRVINWFENQVVDKGWNAAFNKLFPETLSKGYCGFVASPLYLNLYPTQYEKEANLLPKTVCVMGQGLKGMVNTFCDELSVEVAPAFRFQHLWEERKYYANNDFFTTLVALPYNPVQACDLMNIINYLVSHQNRGVRYWIKPHPTSSDKKIKQILGMPSNIVSVKREAFAEVVERSDVLVTAYSNTAIETIAKGIPVIVVGNKLGFTHNSIPKTITDDIWRLCYTPEEVQCAIEFYQTRSSEKIKEHEEAGRRIREEYFKPVTREGVREFLELE
jgi:hypothetical protein